MQKQVFISYATPDREDADAVVTYLEGCGISCFIAPRDVDPGKPYASNLMHAIDNCNAIVLIASDAMNESEHVLNEVDVIVSKRKPLIPFFLKNFEMNDDYRYYLGRTQRIIAYPEAVSTYYSKLLDALVPFLDGFMPQKPEEVRKQQIHTESREAPQSNTTTIFEYIPERGIMINPEDHQRNVSFRTDTFINMMGGIFDSVCEIAGEERAMSIFHMAGYKSGQNFAQRLNSRWDFSENTPSSYENKLKKWCEFDSAVGWGKFSIDVNVNVDTGDFDGELSINECFIVDKKNRKKICEFVKGYCEGVIESLISAQVVLECVSCPMKNRFKSSCVFKIMLDESEQDF